MAALSGFFGSAGVASKRLCQFEIRLDDDFVVLKGNEDETAPFKISGRLVLMNSETVQTKSIHIELEGKRKTTKVLSSEKEKQHGPSTKSPIVNKATIIHKHLDLFGEGKVIKPGNHEWPFEFVMEGDTPESIEGMSGNFIMYSIKATADRGLLAKDLVATKHVRIIRTLSPDSLLLVDPQEINGFWPNKLKYQFSTKSRAAIFGDRLVTDIELTPLIEKLHIGKITISLKEQRKIRTIPGSTYDTTTGSWSGMWKEEQEVVKTELEVPEGSEATDAELQIPMFHFKTCLPLPKSLKTCRQSVEKEEWIRIKHTVHYSILLHNADGHISELKAHHAIRIFISPNLPLEFSGEDNMVPETSTSNRNIESTLMNDLVLAPPAYATHRLDPLYEGIDPAGYLTPGTNNASRRPSIEHLNEQSELNESNHTIHSLALSRRLMSLEVREDDGEGLEATSRNRVSSFDMSPEQNSTLSQDRQFHPAYYCMAGSEPAPPLLLTLHERQHVEFDMGALERMPSYGTAVRTPVRSNLAGPPPTYDLAVSQPPTPT